MAIKFIFDSTQKQEEALANEILELTKHKPSIDDATKKLATFINVVYRTANKKHKLPEETHEKQVPNLLKAAPIELEKTEYLIKLFQTPVGIILDKENGKMFYRVVEPQPDVEIIRAMKEIIKKDFEKNPIALENQAYLQKKFTETCQKLHAQCDADIIRRATYYLKRDLYGFRRLDPLMHDANVTAIFCEGTSKPVRIEYKGLPERIETNVIFKDPKDLNTLINKIASFAKVHLTEATPIMDTTINGFKINATIGIGDISSKLTIKKLDFQKSI